jgi:RNA polymerase sigma factor (sigma-70 family)
MYLCPFSELQSLSFRQKSEGAIMQYQTKSPDWIREIYPVVRRFALCKTRNAELAADLVQDLLEGLVKSENLPDTVNGAWLKTRLSWLAGNRFRVVNREAQIFVPEPEPEEGGWERMEEAGIAGGDQFAAPDTQLYRHELAIQMVRALAKLPEEQRTVMKFVLQEMTDAEIAERMGRSRRHVSDLRHRANASLKHSLAAYHDGGFAMIGNLALDDGAPSNSNSARSTAADRLELRWQLEHKRLHDFAASLHLTWVGPINRFGGLTLWRCSSGDEGCGYEWLDTAKHLEAHNGCPRCLKKRYLTWSHYHAMAKKKGLALIGDKPKRSDIETRWTCSSAGHRLFASYDSVRDWTECPDCQDRYPLSRADYERAASERGGDFIGPLPATRHAHGTWVCIQHGSWPASWNSVVSQHSWCPQCSGKMPKTLQDYKEAATARGGRFLGKLPKNSTTLGGPWQCRLRHRWEARYNDVVSKGSWCPKCAGKVKLTLRDYKNLATMLEITFVGPVPKVKDKLAQWESAQYGPFTASYKDLSVPGVDLDIVIPKRQQAERHRGNRGARK